MQHSSPQLDPGPSWRELEPRNQWTLRAVLAIISVIAYFCAGWVNADFRISVVGVGVTVLVCLLLRDRVLAALIGVGAGCPAIVLMLLQFAIETIEIAPP